ncbi:MAG: hypothetical protein K2M80_03330, partial [Muribaculaceae bacterium]|nr:hypothetical protein [Muribaculaceae bacterium]
MRKLFKISLIAAAVVIATLCHCAKAEPFIIKENILRADKIVLDSAAINHPDLNELVIVNGDTVPIILPSKNYGRYDRGLFNYLIIPKGQWSFGLTASYGQYSTEDVQILSILNDFDIKIKMYSIKPSISYFFRSNQSIGLQFNYSRSFVDVNNMACDFDEDLSFIVRD